MRHFFELVNESVLKKTNITVHGTIVTTVPIVFGIGEINVTPIITPVGEQDYVIVHQGVMVCSNRLDKSLVCDNWLVIIV